LNAIKNQRTHSEQLLVEQFTNEQNEPLQALLRIDHVAETFQQTSENLFQAINERRRNLMASQGQALLRLEEQRAGIIIKISALRISMVPNLNLHNHAKPYLNTMENHLKAIDRTQAIAPQLFELFSTLIDLLQAKRTASLLKIEVINTLDSLSKQLNLERALNDQIAHLKDLR